MRSLFLLKILRALERCLPVDVLYWTIYPVALAVSFRCPRLPARRWPAWLHGESSRPPAASNERQAVTSNIMDALLELLPDRLALPRWRKRCHIVGLEHLRSILRSGAPVVMAFCHFGPLDVVIWYLRAHGVPSAALRFGNAGSRRRVMQYAERYQFFPTIPRAVYLSQLRELVRLMASGCVLYVAIDVPSGQQAGIPLGEDRTFRMATGAMRFGGTARGRINDVQHYPRGTLALPH